MVTYDNCNSIKKIVFSNGVLLDILPNAQNILCTYRQIHDTSSESGGILIGYENAKTGNITISSATKPQNSDIRTRISLFFGIQHNKQLEKIKSPYGYIGTWHTHPTEKPIPSSIDYKDWTNSIKYNQDSTGALIFIIAGTRGFRVWLYESSTEILYEGKLL